MAEGWAKALAGNRFEFWSGGTFPTREVNPYAIAVMEEKGLDISASLPKNLATIPRPLDRIIAVCGQAASSCPASSVECPVERWDLPDPAAATGTEFEKLEVFRESRDEIERLVRDLIERI